MIETFLQLIAGHFIADYPLQSDAIATGKNRNLDPAKFGVPWYYWLISHSATQAMFVGVILQSTWAGLFEFVWHFITDFLKCEKKLTLHQDQLSHIICKIVCMILFGNF